MSQGWGIHSHARTHTAAVSLFTLLVRLPQTCVSLVYLDCKLFGAGTVCYSGFVQPLAQGGHILSWPLGTTVLNTIKHIQMHVGAHTIYMGRNTNPHVHMHRSMQRYITIHAQPCMCNTHTRLENHRYRKTHSPSRGFLHAPSQAARAWDRCGQHGSGEHVPAAQRGSFRWVLQAKQLPPAPVNSPFISAPPECRRGLRGTLCTCLSSAPPHLKDSPSSRLCPAQNLLPISETNDTLPKTQDAPRKAPPARVRDQEQRI